MNYKKKFVIAFVLIATTIVIFLVNSTNSNKYSIVKIKAQNPLLKKEGFGIVYKIKKEVYIITNYHIISNMDVLTISYGKNNVRATLVNGDEYEDIAVLKVKKDKLLKKAKFKYRYHKNDKVWFNNYNGNIIKGNITENSTKQLIRLSDGNYLLKVIGLNLKISDGDSGSALFNRRGKVIGMITMRKDNAKDIGYALDIQNALKIANKLELGKIKRIDLRVKVASSSNQDILTQYNLSSNFQEGVIVVENKGSKILKKGDVITQLNDIKIKDVVHFKYYLYNSSKIRLKVYRNNKYINLDIKK